MKRQLTPMAVFLLVLLAASGLAQKQTTAPEASKKSATDQQEDAAEKAGKAVPPPGAGPLAKPALPGRNLIQVPKPQAIPIDAGYVIGPQDVLEIDVWQEREFSRSVPVRPDGKITLPLLNDIQAAGLTPTQLAASITELLKKYITSPQVSVTVAQINSRLIFMTGEVNRPGAIPLLPNMTVLQAISMAGGPNQFANPKKTYVLRTENGKQVKYPFNYKAAIRGTTTKENILLKPGDTIVIP